MTRRILTLILSAVAAAVITGIALATKPPCDPAPVGRRLAAAQGIRGGLQLH